jgi:hypothetical protein
MCSMLNWNAERLRDIESGMVRLSARELYAVAKLLKCSMSDFFNAENVGVAYRRS